MSEPVTLLKPFIREQDMMPKKFYDWLTAGGTGDVMRMVDAWKEQMFCGVQSEALL